VGEVNGPLPFDPVEEARRHWIDHGWSEAADGMVAVTSIMRAQQLLLGRADGVLRPLGLTFARYEVLMLLLFSSRGSLPMKTIGGRLQVHPTSVTNAVDRLEGAGLVKRVPHPQDGRAVLVKLSPKGKRTALSATELLNVKVFREPGLSTRKLGPLVGALRELRQRAGDF
jgi:DNA-binding MarR family transcriptional regulator